MNNLPEDREDKPEQRMNSNTQWFQPIGGNGGKELITYNADLRSKIWTQLLPSRGENGASSMANLLLRRDFGANGAISFI